MAAPSQSLNSLDDFRTAVLDRQLERPIIEQCLDTFKEVFEGSNRQEISGDNLSNLFSKCLASFNKFQNSVSKRDDDPMFDGLNILYLFVDMLSIADAGFRDDPALSVYFSKLPGVIAAIARLKEKHSNALNFAMLALAAQNDTEKMAELQNAIKSAAENAASDASKKALATVSFGEWIAAIAFMFGLVVGLVQFFDNSENWWVPILLGFIVAGALFWRGTAIVITSIDR